MRIICGVSQGQNSWNVQYDKKFFFLKYWVDTNPCTHTSPVFYVGPSSFTQKISKRKTKIFIIYVILSFAHRACSIDINPKKTRSVHVFRKMNPYGTVMFVRWSLRVCVSVMPLALFVTLIVRGLHWNAQRCSCPSSFSSASILQRFTFFFSDTLFLFLWFIYYYYYYYRIYMPFLFDIPRPVFASSSFVCAVSAQWP